VRETEGEIFYESAKCGKMGLKNKKIPMRPFYTEIDIKRKETKTIAKISFPPFLSFLKDRETKTNILRDAILLEQCFFFSSKLSLKLTSQLK
jgi:hypothetical protein